MNVSHLALLDGRAKPELVEIHEALRTNKTVGMEFSSDRERSRACAERTETLVTCGTKPVR